MMNAAFVVFAASAVFAGSVGLLVARRVETSVLLLSIQGVALTIMVLTTSPLNLGQVALGLVTLVIKAGLIPGVMYRLLREWPLEYRRDGVLPAWAFVAGAVLLLTVTHTIRLLTPTGIVLHTSLFFYGLSSIYLNLLQMISRRHVLSQVGALVAAENGFVILAASVAGDLPMFMELGMLVDVSVAALILVWLSRLVHGKFNTTDVTTLRFLRR